MADEKYSVEDRLGMLRIDTEQDRKVNMVAFAGLEAALERLEARQARTLSALMPLIGRLQATVDNLRDEVSAGRETDARRGQVIDTAVESLRGMVRTLQHSQDKLLEQFSVLCRKSRRADERLDALEARGA